MAADDERFNVFLPDDIPAYLDSPYFKSTEMEHHYPNMYDFRRAAIFNSPRALFAPFDRKMFVPKSRPSYMREEDYGVRADWLSAWGNARVRHTNTSLARLTLFKH
ncbi:uncharacterized protein LOC131927815 [Physella acuta]|uniref:uncharacterized protein LOC131927815 n=1 Tax=Physella acuta TaxID=109671 RepID=UPI0027DC86DC|nr:uncharacterized protein LOC131927815 [Physella acuta]XP_059139644.1 uncharacterized protein LOC131927815 [Physella acuta]